MSEPTKICTKCKEYKPLCSFSFQNKEMGLLHSQCSDCKYYPKPADGTNMRKCSDCGLHKHYKDEFAASNTCCKPCFYLRKLKRGTKKKESISSSQTQIIFKPVDLDDSLTQGVCPTITKEEKSTHKPCERCNELRLLSDYHINNNKQCRFCIQVLKAERMESIQEFLKDKWQRAKDRAKKKNIEFTVTLEQWEYIHFVRQRALCALTGGYMTHKASTKLGDDIEKFPFNISPDRIDSKKGYTFENVQFVRWCINSAKNDMEQEAFIQMCGEVWEHHKKGGHSHWTPGT
jgi:hypothetical protein